MSRSRGRDGFRHLTRGAGGHAPEGVFHLQGKAVLAQWLRSRFPGLTVEIESGIDTQRSSVADVMATSPSGRRVAFEVQYSPLSVASWLERHRRYAQAGVTDVWLFGHTGPHLRYRATDNELRLTALNSEVLSASISQTRNRPLTSIHSQVDRIVTNI